MAEQKKIDKDLPVKSAAAASVDDKQFKQQDEYAIPTKSEKHDDRDAADMRDSKQKSEGQE